MRTSTSKILAATLLIAGLGTAPARSQPAADESKPFTPASPAEKAIVDEVDAFVKAYDAADVKALAELYDDQAILIDAEGGETRGKPAIARMYAEAFKELGALKLESHIRSVTFLTDDAARVEGLSRLSTPKGDAAEFSRFASLIVRKDGRWKIAEIREAAAPVDDVSPHERLQELEWMIGDWVNEGVDDRIAASVRWADGRNYLIRTYSIELRGEKQSSGTMFIGWDPQSGQIKSWLFDSHGGHGEGYWTRTAENEWVVKAQGVLRDGLPNSATQIHAILSKDSVKTSSIDRIIGGQLAPDIRDVVMVRKAPAPAAAPAPGPAAERPASPR